MKDNTWNLIGSFLLGAGMSIWGNAIAGIRGWIGGMFIAYALIIFKEIK